MKVEKNYVFDGPNGRQTLSDLFEGRSQLIVSHFMLGPGWKEGCVGCSFRSDHVDGTLAHLEHHDVSFVTISRAPLSEINTFRTRMGWNFHNGQHRSAAISTMTIACPSRKTKLQPAKSITTTNRENS